LFSYPTVFFTTTSPLSPGSYTLHFVIYALLVVIVILMINRLHDISVRAATVSMRAALVGVDWICFIKGFQMTLEDIGGRVESYIRL